MLRVDVGRIELASSPHLTLTLSAPRRQRRLLRNAEATCGRGRRGRGPRSGRVRWGEATRKSVQFLRPRAKQIRLAHALTSPIVFAQRIASVEGAFKVVARISAD